MHQALYRKYRPATFDEVCGQGHITDVLRHEAEHGNISHAYLFCGSRGTGKTSCAKILARAVNCEAPVRGNPCGKCPSCREIAAGTATDVVEMDAASNNGVDAIRQLCEETVYTPASMQRKVYIIDEVHMLTGNAWAALLKTIEEPPEHVLFILATTEQHKVPATIISRCQRFDFRRLDTKVLCDRLQHIAAAEHMTLTEDAAILLARQAQGGMRDAIGLFELCGAGGADITGDRVRAVLGLSGYDTAAATMRCVAEGNVDGLFSIVSDVTASSKDVSVYWQELQAFVRDMLVCKYADDPTGYLDLTAQEYETLSEVTARFTLGRLIHICSVLDDAAAKMTRTPNLRRMTAEISFLKMCRPELDESPAALSRRIAALEDRLSLAGMATPADGAEQAPAPAKEPAPAPQPAPRIAQTEPPAPVADMTTPEAPQEPQEPQAASNPSETFDPVPDISEALSRLDSAHMGLARFLYQADVFVSRDGKILRIAADPFAASLLSREGDCAAVADAFALARITDGRAKVQITTRTKQKKDDPADEIGKLL